MGRNFRSIIGIIALGFMLSPHAFAQSAAFGGAVGLDPSFCRPHNIRQTVVYVDDTSLVTNQTGWAVSIYDKLKASLVPGERVTLVELSPKTGQSAEIWSGCWPAYTAEQRDKLSGESHFFSRSPLATLTDQQNYFARDFGVSAQQIQNKGQRPLADVRIDPENPPDKSIIRALASDDGRYAHTDNTIRAILYSDLAENSDLGSVFKPLPDSPPTYGDKLGTSLRRSVFYAFGAGANVQGSGTVMDGIRAFWDGALRSMAANLGGIGSDLNVPNVVPEQAASYDVALADNGANLAGRLSLLVDHDGTLVDSWIGITRLRNASITGTYHCTGSTATPSCTLQANTVGGVVSMSPVETITLTNRNGKALTGKIGVQGSDVFLPLAALPVTN